MIIACLIGREVKIDNNYLHLIFNSRRYEADCNRNSLEMAF